MDVKRTTLHFKILTDRCFYMKGWTPSDSLCVYFWQVVFRFCCCLFVVAATVAPLVSVISYVTGTQDSSHILVQFYSYIGVIVGFFYGVALVTFIISSYIIRREAHKKTTKPKQPSIIIEYIKAKKDKVCPMINFID
jgi:predicted neutral ceramidase superfamily lipid hydrolase